ncbi:MAG: copper chaperone PCu(A)C [Vulcanimicrobiaceae bacterium]|jgi:copper(I)-binding protein
MIAPLLLAAVTVTGAWSRPAIDTGVVYAQVHNSSGHSVALVSASTARARHAELHQSTSSMGTMQGMTMPMESMHPVSHIVIPPRGTIALSPGGYHLMLLGLRGPLVAGQHLVVTFHFSDGEVVHAAATVENRAL